MRETLLGLRKIALKMVLSLVYLTFSLDFVYLTCGYGFYVIRPEQKRFSFFQTSYVAELIDLVNKEQK